MGVTGAIPPSRTDEEAFAVWSINADSLRTWLACETQWRVAAGMAGLIWLGLDYAGVNVVLTLLAPDDPAALFADLQIMEDAALAAFSEAAS